MKEYISPIAEIVTIASSDSITISDAVGEGPGAAVGGGGGGFFD